eukprot:SAG31_NODE_19151_length_610_cov_1.954990_1_plen_44_part_10
MSLLKSMSHLGVTSQVEGGAGGGGAPTRTCRRQGTEEAHRHVRG